MCNLYNDLFLKITLDKLFIVICIKYDMICMMMIMVTFTPNIVVMIIVVIIAMMSDVPMGPSLVRLSVSQEAICLIPASSH